MKKISIRWQLVFYDLLILLAVDCLLLFLYPGYNNISIAGMAMQALISCICIFVMRFAGSIYQQVWRYGGLQGYLRLLLTDGIAFCLIQLMQIWLPERLAFPRLLSISCMNLLGALAMRMMYQYVYRYGNASTRYGRFLNLLLRIFAGAKVEGEQKRRTHKIKIAIVGAGRIGVALAEELMNNATSYYEPQCFVDVNVAKVNRRINGVPVLMEDEATFDRLKQYEVQEVVFALPNLDDERRKELYDRYVRAGYKIKVYDYPVMHTAGGRRHLREFDVAELLFRKPVVIEDEKTNAYYRDKVILITGGGGSIGSELCRQLAKMEPKQIIVMDIYENGAYDIQQELRIIYGDKVDIRIEIASICSKKAMGRIFAAYHPQIVINAAAHKHVPLMEHNCIEAIENNVFGTVNLVTLCEEYDVERFMMVSTDKAVNPTNVMGATKRLCEMIVQSASTYGKVKYSATRFGNVLGSAGSVIPLFKKQIANGGPITITDKRIIRYFMTIPEASQLVLQSGAMAQNGELFVLDMGQPVKILDLAESMIRLSGVKGIEIVETGLRPGEKLYEELLIQSETLEKTENSLIFIERDIPCSQEDIKNKLSTLSMACMTGQEDMARDALHEVVSTYKEPEEVNACAEQAEEMKNPVQVVCMEETVSVKGRTVLV